MDNEATRPNKVFNQLDITIHDLLRYGYAGLLAFFVAGITHPADTNRLLQILGPIVATIAAFTVGAGIYAIHRAFMSEIFSFASEHCHRHCFNHPTTPTCRSAYIMSRFDIPTIWIATEAYRTLRESELFDKNRRDYFHRLHSEHHMVLMTSWVLLFGAVIAYVIPGDETPASVYRLMVVAGLLALLSGFVKDMLICRQECKYIVQLDEGRIKDLLKKAKFTV